jgi:predicted nucleic acid-binding protein
VQIEFADASHHQAAKNWLSRLCGHQISYADAVSFAVMETKGCRTAMSCDDHFRQAGFDRHR